MNAGGSWRPGFTPEEQEAERREKLQEAALFCGALLLYAAIWALIFRALTG